MIIQMKKNIYIIQVYKYININETFHFSLFLIFNYICSSNDLIKLFSSMLKNDVYYCTVQDYKS